MAWVDDACPFCEKYGQDCGAHGLCADAADTLQTLVDPFITLTPKAKFL